MSSNSADIGAMPVNTLTAQIWAFCGASHHPAGVEQLALLAPRPPRRGS
jgi:hypothetical protein